MRVAAVSWAVTERRGWNLVVTFVLDMQTVPGPELLVFLGQGCKKKKNPFLKPRKDISSQ